MSSPPARTTSTKTGALTADAGQVWLGTGATASGSYLGLRFTGVTIPAGATVTAAQLEVNAATTQWTAVAFELAAEAATNSAPFSAASLPSQRTLLAPRVTHESDTQWVAGHATRWRTSATLIRAAVQQPGWAGRALTIVVRGTGGAWARKQCQRRERFGDGAPAGRHLFDRRRLAEPAAGDHQQRRRRRQRGRRRWR